MTEPTGRQINEWIRAGGVVPLVDIRGDRITFYPRGRLSAYAVAYLNSHDSRNAKLLRDFCVTLGRGLA
jgi:hypothetical protein